MAELWIPMTLLAICFVLGGLPLTGWITRAFSGQSLQDLGTGNVSVSAAFYHGGTGAGILAVLSEAMKGIGAVLLFRVFFPGHPVWELVGLMALVGGRFLLGRGAGTTNVVWGYIVHDWKTAFLVAVIGGIGFTLVREKRLGRLSILVLLPIVTALLHSGSVGRIIAVMLLSAEIALIYHLIPDDLDLAVAHAHPESKTMFKFFQGDRAIQSLSQRLSPQTAGNKAARLSELKRLGYPVPQGWVLPPGDDPHPLIDALTPSPQQPLVVRSSAFGEDTMLSSAAGQYDSVLNVTSRDALRQAIAQCQLSYSKASAVQYRRDRQVDEGAMAVLIQEQVRGAFSGVAFSRDPVTRQGEAVIVEALPGTADQVVSGRKTPEYYRVFIPENQVGTSNHKPSRHGATNGITNGATPAWQIPKGLTVLVEGNGDVPPSIIKQVAYLTRHLEKQLGDVPQDVEWSYDGKQLWVLQVRPITTLLPIWTRKIAAEVIPGFIRPLTWSINRPLTCGVWGEIFTVVLGDRAKGLDFEETATLHHSSAYFNATLLGDIFLRMGLPPESLEFLTRGAKFSRPPILSTFRNTPGLLRLFRREWDLLDDFAREEPQLRADLFKVIQQEKDGLSTDQLLANIQTILHLLKRVTYYNILAPLSVALRQAILKVPDEMLDTSVLPEVAALRSLKDIAASSRPLIPNAQRVSVHRSTLFVALAENPDGQSVLDQLEQFLDTYGYLSDVATDIAVPTWKDDPRPVYDLFAQLVSQSESSITETSEPIAQTWKVQQVQQRLNLKGTVAELYNRLLAELRACVLIIEQQWLSAGILMEQGDIFFLTLDEIQHYAGLFADRPPVGANSGASESSESQSNKSESSTSESSEMDDHTDLLQSIHTFIHARKTRWEKDAEVSNVPFLVYGKEPPLPSEQDATIMMVSSGTQLTGIGASPGQVQGIVKVVRSLQSLPTITKAMILVVPYADSGWAPLLAQSGGLVADVGGRLSHGAIVAREYGIPAVMNLQNATSTLRDGQTIILDGESGTVTLL